MWIALGIVVAALIIAFAWQPWNNRSGAPLVETPSAIASPTEAPTLYPSAEPSAMPSSFMPASPFPSVSP
ncbi:MAG: hypothetical protein ACREM8_04410 [Vulcanimicrobiaceae bacterium]